MQLRALDALVHHPLPKNFHGFIGASPQTFEIFDEIRLAASTNWPVLLRGETGTGKELLARAVHLYSDVRDGPFVALNCGALSPELAASELFGHVQGAYTDAQRAREGAFSKAEGGTLFLDEIGDLPAQVQAALLRVLEVGEYKPLGSDSVRKVGSVRLVAATHKDVEDGQSFRLDLFHRLDGWTIQVPALRHRPSDIVPIAEGLLEELAPGFSFDASARSALTAFAWPGNVRQLRNTVRRAAKLAAGSKITVKDLRLDLSLTPQEARKQQLRRELEKHEGCLSAWSRELGTTRYLAQKRLEEAGLDLATEQLRNKILRLRRDYCFLVEEGNVARAAASRGEADTSFAKRLQRADHELLRLFELHKTPEAVAQHTGLEAHELRDLLRLRATARKVSGATPRVYVSRRQRAAAARGNA